MIEPTERIQRALEFAALAHRRQVRKDTEIPYIIHPVAVAWHLQAAGCEEELVVAGLLHDVTEDAQVTPEALRELFGNRVASIVASCSEPDKSLPWVQRKEHTIRQLLTGDDDCRAVAAADKLHNAQSMLADFRVAGHALWSRFKQGYHHQAWYYGSVFNAILCTAQRPEVKEIAFKLYRVLEELFSPDFETRWQAHPDRRRFIALSRRESKKRSQQAPEGGGDWLLAVNPETLAARWVVRLPGGCVPDIEGHEDLFPPGMLFEHPDGFLPGGDWVVACTPECRPHDGGYRSYFIKWEN